MNEQCIWCHADVCEEATSLCRKCLDSWSRACDAGWVRSDLEGLPFVILFVNSVQFSVRSEKSASVWYSVGHDCAEAIDCTCPSHQYRPVGPCKHMQVVTAALMRKDDRVNGTRRGEAPLGSTRSFSLYR